MKKLRNNLYIVAVLALQIVVAGCQSSKLTIAVPQQTIVDTGAIVQVKQVLQEQSERWSAGDLEGYMQGYWKSDSLLFVGKSGLTYGWQQTLDNYKRGYPDVSAMGKLTFDLKEVRPLGAENILVVGKWHLQRDPVKGNLEGHFSVIFQRFSDGWKIVADHSS